MRKVFLGSLAAATLLYADVYDLGRVEVSAQSDISQNKTIEVVDSQTIKDTESKTVVEALQEIPGLFIDNNGAKNQNDIRIRGFKKSRVPVYVDGIPVYVPYNRETDLSRFTTYDVSEITVSKGYTSPMYGANTMGGAINIVTKKPTKAFEGEIGAGIFSGNGQEEYLTMGTNQGSYYGLISVSNYQRDYFKLSNDFTSKTYENGGKRENSDSQDRKLNLKVGYTPNNTDEYSFNYIAQRGEKGQPYYADVSAPFVGASMQKRHWRWPDWDKTSYYVITKTAMGENMLKTRWYRDEFYNKMADYGSLPGSANATIPTSTSEYDDYALGGNIELDFKLSTSQMLKLSVSQKNDYHKDISSASPGADIKVEGTTTSYGLEYSLQATDKLTWVAGASYDQNEVQKAQYRNAAQTAIQGEYPKYDSDALNPETALYYKLNDTTTLYGSIAKKSNMPSLADRYSTKFGTVIPNPDLKAEQSLNYELGIEHKLSDSQLLKTAIFLSKADDYIAQVSIGGGNTQYQNIGKEEHKGLEVSLDSWWDDTLSSNVAYAYIDAEVKDNIVNPYVADIPKHSFMASLKYSPIAMIDLIPQLRYESERYVRSEAIYSGYQTKDFMLMDFKIAYRAMKDLELSAGIKNIFDKNYYYSFGYPQEGRSYYANARYTF